MEPEVLPVQAQPVPSLSHTADPVAGKGVVISGGTTGIGRATALLLASQGARVLIFGRSEQHLNDSLRDISTVGEVYGVMADQARPEDIQRVFQEADNKLKRLDILINNAGISGENFVEEGDYEHWEYIVQDNLLGYIGCTREAVNRMRKNGGGHIVNIGSMSAQSRGGDDGVYVATKAAIQALSESVRKAVNKHGIKVSLIEPGSVGTDMNEKSPAEQAKEQARDKLLKAEDVAWCIHYCLTQPRRCDVIEVRIQPHHQED